MKTFLKNKRGFSLVELMVVVAIMGTLATIAIPAYNEYRKSAKKTAYKTDMLSVHKGWLAFGVELDSFCLRETQPRSASITSIGMQSLLNSKLYGKNSSQSRVAPTCTAPASTPEPANCVAPGETGVVCTGCSDSSSTLNAGNAATTGNGPGKHNFIGFGDDNCTAANLTSRQILGNAGTTNTTHDANCDLNTSTYEIGVYGHISGKNYYGVSVSNNGVASSEFEDDSTPATADSECAT